MKYLFTSQLLGKLLEQTADAWYILEDGIGWYLSGLSHETDIKKRLSSAD